jgi:CheY-like chemotaxis protein
VLLESWGARVIASDYLDDETVEVIQSTTLVHAILCDFNLGDDRLTGLQLIPSITRLIGYRVPSILLTAVSTDEIQAQYIRELALLNAQEAALFAMPQILQKPASGETLNAALHAAVTEAEVRIAKQS